MKANDTIYDGLGDLQDIENNVTEAFQGLSLIHI